MSDLGETWAVMDALREKMRRHHALPWFHDVLTNRMMERGKVFIVSSRILDGPRAELYARDKPVTVLHPATWIDIREEWDSLRGCADIDAEVKLRRDERLRWADDGARS